MTRANKIIIGVGAALAALLILVAVLLVVIVNQNSAADDQRELERVNAICEESFADPYGEDLDELAACQQELLDR